MSGNVKATFKKVTIAFLLMVTALIGGMMFLMPYLINKDTIKTELTSSFKSLTGFDVQIQGDAIVKRWPAPHIVINSLYVRNAPAGVAPFFITVKKVDVWPSYKSFFNHKIIIQKIDIDNVDVEVERLKSGQMNWKDSSVQTSAPEDVTQITTRIGSGLVGTRINITNAYLKYANEASNETTEFKDATLNYINGGANAESSLAVKMNFRGQPINIFGKVSSITNALSAQEVPASLTVSSGKSNLSYSGTASYKDGGAIVNGTIAFNTDDLVTWVGVMLAKNEKLGVDENYRSLPLQVKTDVKTAEDGKVSFPNVTLEGDIIKGGAEITYSPPYGLDVKSIIKQLDVEKISESRIFTLKDSPDPFKDAGSSKESVFMTVQKSLFESLNLLADVRIEDSLYNQQHIKDCHVELDMANGEMTISQATATLPGDSRVIFAGIGKQGFQGFALEGELDASGANFAEAVKVLKANGASFPAEDFKRFRLKANALLSSKGLRMSEMAARIENMAFLGGFISTFGERTKVEASLRIGGVNLDHFVKLWGIDEWRNSLSDSAAIQSEKHETFLGNWLKRLDFDTVMNISLEQFTLQDQVREKADLRMQTTSGKVHFEDVKTAYNGSNITGEFLLDVTGSLPKVEVKANFDKFDMATFFGPEAKAKPEEKATPSTERWSRKVFDFRWFDILTAQFHFNFGQYTQGLIHAKSLDVLGSLEGQHLNIESLSGIIQGAQVASKILIKSGAIPSVNFAANINSLEPAQMVPFFPILQDMSGKFNLSLRLDASGIDPFSWVSSLEGTIGLGGENIDVRGFNLAGVIHSVSYVRTVADILNVVKRAFPGGDTLFTGIEGQWTVTSGVLRTVNSKLANAQADGILTSQVDLVNWQMQSSLNLALKALDPAHPPGMSIGFVGSIDTPETSLDTRSLEQYVTNKTSEQMLHEYGTGTQ